MKTSLLISCFFISFLFFPYFILGLELPRLVLPESGEFLWALKNSCLQAAASAFASLVLAFFFAMGFSYLVNFFSERRYFNQAVSFLEILILLPTFLPALFIILIAMAVVEPEHMPRAENCPTLNSPDT
jgi:ABC-type Fe3+ transport system permease subunit